MDYEALKRYPYREIKILTDTMNELNKHREEAINKARSGKSSGPTTPIGQF